MGDIYFKINEKNLFLDYMLEELNNMPFFYVCKDSNNEKYLVLCTDFEDEKYIIVRISLHDLKGMLYGSMDIRSVFLDKKCWIFPKLESEKRIPLRRNHVSCAVGNTMFVHGGFTEDNTYLDDMYILNYMIYEKQQQRKELRKKKIIMKR